MAKSGPKVREFTDHERLIVKYMAIAGVPQERIAKAIECSDKSLRRHFRDELDSSMDKANAQVVGALFKNAMNGNVSAQIFWAKTRLGWKETSVSEINAEIKNAGFTLVIEGKQLPESS